MGPFAVQRNVTRSGVIRLLMGVRRICAVSNQDATNFILSRRRENAPLLPSEGKCAHPG